MLGLILLAVGTVCPASSQPGWATASALERRTMLRACVADGAPAPAEQPLEPPVTPPPPSWHPAARISLQAGAGLAVTAGSLSLFVWAGSQLQTRGAAEVLIPLGLTLMPPLIGATVFLTGRLVGGRGNLGWTMLGSLIGTSAVVASFLVGQAAINIEAGGGVAPALVAMVFPSLGSVLAHEFSGSRQVMPTIAFVPHRDGGSLLVALPL